MDEWPPFHSKHFHLIVDSLHLPSRSYRDSIENQRWSLLESLKSLEMENYGDNQRVMTQDRSERFLSGTLGLPAGLIHATLLGNEKNQRDMLILLNRAMEQLSMDPSLSNSIIVGFRKLRESIHASSYSNSSEKLSFYISVYEAAATSAIQLGDEEEAFTCLVRLVNDWYKKFKSSNQDQFQSLYILYVCRLTNIDTAASDDVTSFYYRFQVVGIRVGFAVTVHQSISECNYIRFFRLYSSATPLEATLMETAFKVVLFPAMKIRIMKSYKSLDSLFKRLLSISPLAFHSYIKFGE